MKIGIFTDTFYPEVNGVATSCLNLMHGLERMGHEVHVYAPKCKGLEPYDHPNVHYLVSTPFIFLKDRNIALPGYHTFIQTKHMDFDVVHTQSEFVMGVFGRYVARKCNCPLVHTYHTVWEDYTYYITHGHKDAAAKKVAKRYSEWWCQRTDRTIVPTAKTENLLRQYGVKGAIDIIPSGMEIDRFFPENHSQEEIAQTKLECGVREGERVLLYIGRLAKEKNVEQIVRVFPKLREHCPDVRLVIIGEGPMLSVLRKMAKKLEVSDAVSLIGAKPWEKIDRYYAIGDVFASASHSETQGLTYLEAMASGLCVCAVKDPCLYGVIEDGINGILTGDSDEEFLHGLTISFSFMGKSAGQRAAGTAVRYSVAPFAQKVLDCYTKAVAERNPSPKRALIRAFYGRKKFFVKRKNKA